LIQESCPADFNENLNAGVHRSAEIRPHEPSLLRLFLSFNPCPDVIIHLRQAQKALRHLLEDTYGPALPIRWTRSFQFHLTVLFFGNTPPTQVDLIKARLVELVREHSEFPCLTAKAFGCFPAFHRPRVLWIGFASNPLLRSWQDRLVKAFERDFVWKEKDLSYPHVTIARLDFQRLPARFGDRLFHLAQETGMPTWDWQIDSISLMRSIPGPKGSDYVCLANFPGSCLP
jgi:2'-5' RNA ligase